MGCLTAKASGTVASFINPTVTDIESARVYFSPTQLGEGTPSPENVREIVGRTGVELYRNKKSVVSFLKDSISPTSHYNGFFNWSTTWKIPDRTKKYTYYVYIDNTKGTQSATAKLWFRNEDNSAYVSTKSSVSVNVGESKWVSVVATIDENSYYICFGLDIYAGTTAKHPMVFEGNESQTETIPFSWKRLPDEYQEVEYIESDGNQSIYTDVSSNKLVNVDLVAQFTQSTKVSQVVFYCSENAPNWFGQNAYVYACGTTANAGSLSNIDSTLKKAINIVFDTNSITCTIEDTTFVRTLTNGHQNGRVYKIFNIDNYPSHARVYSCKIHHDGEKIVDYIPCYRKSDGEIGLYDIVSNTFYTNQGTGTFTKGDDVFSDEVYGGYVDLAKGELVEEYKRIRLDANTPSEFAIQSNGLYTIWRYIDGMALGNTNEFFNDTKILCNSIQKVLSRGSIPTTQLGILFGNNSNNIYLYNMDSVYGYTTKEQISAWLDENPIYVTVPLATPITHQLPDYLKTQLQTLKNENTFWSDADSVEIEYDLAETFDIQKAKRKIIMNQPHVETLTGDAVSFTTDMKAPLKECKVSFMPVQEGSGDPSPTNVRNITGWNGVSVKNGENTYSIDWTDDVGTVYGGYVDLMSGELVVEYECLTDTWGNWGTLYDQEDGTELRYKRFQNDIIGNGAGADCSYCNVAKYRYVNANETVHFYNVASSKNCRIYLPSGTDESLQIQAVGKLITPITYQLTPEQILSLKGINNFSCGIKNDMTVKYWKHKLSDSTNIAYEAENLTFDGTNYIDTGVYLFSEKNINRNFEVVIEDLYGNYETGSVTIVCAKYDSKAIGFLIRLNDSTSITYNGTISMKASYNNNITIRRINGVITCEGSIINNPRVKFTNEVHQHPLVLGCALQDNGTPFRYATGTIGHITVKWL